MMWLYVYIVGYVTVAIFTVGAFFADMQESFPSLAVEHRRKDLGMAILFGMLYGLLWPILWIGPILLTGFLEHGWYLRPRRR